MGSWRWWGCNAGTSCCSEILLIRIIHGLVCVGLCVWSLLLRRIIDHISVCLSVPQISNSAWAAIGPLASAGRGGAETYGWGRASVEGTDPLRPTHTAEMQHRWAAERQTGGKKDRTRWAAQRERERQTKKEESDRKRERDDEGVRQEDKQADIKNWQENLQQGEGAWTLPHGEREMQIEKYRERGRWTLMDREGARHYEMERQTGRERFLSVVLAQFQTDR